MRSLVERPWRWMRAEGGEEQDRVVVHGRRIYILPTRYGVLFGALLALMLIGALNYDNQPAYLLTFTLVGLGANAMYQTWRNLRGISVEILPGDPVFCGHTLRLRVRMSADDGASHYAIQVQAEDRQAIDDVERAAGSRTLELPVVAHRRGRYRIERLILSTRYPLGLFNAWCYVAPRGETLVYPRPGDPLASVQMLQPALAGKRSEGEGNDDFVGLRDYRPGDSLKHIDWKSLARERGLMTKQFSGEQGSAILLEWFSVSSSDSEWKLSLFTRVLLDAEQAGLRYALHMPGNRLAAGSGHRHLHACLSVLACFE